MVQRLDGVDLSQPAPGLYDELDCGICGNRMIVIRNVNGPRNFAEGMSETKALHDLFECPKRLEEWHQQAKALFRLAKETPSHALAKIFLEEANMILESEKPTKKDWTSQYKGFHNG